MNKKTAIINGWVTRDVKGRLGLSVVYPSRIPFKGIWVSTIPSVPLNKDLFPQVSWKHNPVPVTISIIPNFDNLGHLEARGIR